MNHVSEPLEGRVLFDTVWSVSNDANGLNDPQGVAPTFTVLGSTQFNVTAAQALTRNYGVTEGLSINYGTVGAGSYINYGLNGTVSRYVNTNLAEDWDYVTAEVLVGSTVIASQQFGFSSHLTNTTVSFNGGAWTGVSDTLLMTLTPGDFENGGATADTVWNLDANSGARKLPDVSVHYDGSASALEQPGATLPYSVQMTAPAALAFGIAVVVKQSDGDMLQGPDYAAAAANVTQYNKVIDFMPADFGGGATAIKYASVALVDDDLPEWTETMTLSVHESASTPFYSAAGDPITFTVYDAIDQFRAGFPVILSANADDDNGNAVADSSDSTTGGGGDDDLYEVPLTVPRAPGESVTLTATNASQFRAWSDRSKTTLLLGTPVGGGTTVSSVTWNNNTAPQNVYAEGIEDSASANAIGLTVSAAKGAETKNGSANLGTAVKVKISDANYNTAYAFNGNLHDRTAKRLLGAVNAPVVTVEAPAGLIGSTAAWNIDGGGAMTPVEDWAVDATTGTVVYRDWSDNNTAIGYDAGAGEYTTSTTPFAFNNSGTAEISVTLPVSGTGGVPLYYTLQSHAPTVTENGLGIGGVSISHAFGDSVASINSGYTYNGTDYGMAWANTLSLPAGFASGGADYDSEYGSAGFAYLTMQKFTGRELRETGATDTYYDAASGYGMFAWNPFFPSSPARSGCSRPPTTARWTPAPKSRANTGWSCGPT